ncbi:hypothetical protein WOLCODRAFT_147063 [Wolfiporia cocos MD-104 SS10]|uniref:BRCT domain-containing protein n=1 Tax=Wolfiporia cocos (strain MD-104) TaxID=742152 RepID=A0A2H3ISA0_WOLCO|nr:hypothetical protein WOLCODRAFT_147063 [Wolfiporia cocos MD-104 SS10]
MPPPPDAFAAVFFFVSRTLDPTRCTELTDTLVSTGATAVPLVDARLTHLITASLLTDDALEVLPEGSSASLVTPTWAERSRVLGAPLAAEHFSPDPAMLFSGVTVSAVDLGQADTELLSTAITALGGQ